MSFSDFVAELEQCNDPLFEIVLGITIEDFKTLLLEFKKLRDSTSKLPDPKLELYGILIYKRWPLNSGMVGRLILNSGPNAAKDGKIFIANIEARLNSALDHTPEIQKKISTQARITSKSITTLSSILKQAKELYTHSIADVTSTKVKELKHGESGAVATSPTIESKPDKKVFDSIPIGSFALETKKTAEARIRSFIDNFDTIYCQPVDSSGDVYHVASYMIMCKEFGWPVPNAIFFCDTEDTKRQATRCKDFLSALGFSEQVSTEKFARTEDEKVSYQPRPRLKKSMEMVKKYTDSAVDQKVTTSLLSFAHLELGELVTSKILHYFEAISLKTWAQPAFKWAEAQVKDLELKLKIATNRFVILNLRASTKANSGQIISVEQFKSIATVLAQQGCRLIILDVGGGDGKIFSDKYNEGTYAKSIAINPFPSILDQKYQKFAHIFLMMQLSKYNTFAGVIGNTSGTLDIAAFMGLRTLCIHRFKGKSKSKVIVPYQDLRVLLQANIMSVFDFAERLYGLRQMIVMWLNTKQHILCHNLSSAENVRIEEDRFRMDHCERKCFAENSSCNNVNHAFTAQFNQINCDQKLSTSLNNRIAAAEENTQQHTRSSTPNTTPILTAYRHSRDEVDIKGTRSYGLRNKSLPPTPRKIDF